MTPIAINQERTGSGPGLSIVLILVAFAVGVTLSAHAVQRHGAEAEAVRRCMDKNGPTLVFKNRVDPTYYLMCQLDNGKWGIQAVDESGNEKTAFVPRDGLYKSVRAYIDQFATRYNGQLPWLK